MRKFFTLTNIICVGVAGFAVASIIYVNVTNINFSSEPDDEAAPVVEVQTGNPLLKATKDDVAGWFLGPALPRSICKTRRTTAVW